MAQASLPQQWNRQRWRPESSEDELAAGFVRLARQLRSVHGNAAAIACLSAVMRLEPIRVSGVAEELALDTSTVSRLVNQLVATGLLTRTADPADHRAWLLAVTPEGLSYVREGMLRRAEVLRAATADWSPADLTALTGLINRLADDLAATISGKEHV